jgi:hypothetical protein
VYGGVRHAAIRTDQFGGQLITAAFTGDWIDANLTSTVGYGKTFGTEVGASFADGRALASAEGAIVEMADGGIDLAVAATT